MTPAARIVGAGLLIEMALATTVALGDLRYHVALLLILYTILFLLMLFAVRTAGAILPRSTLVFAVLFRLTLLGVTPSLSDDIYRYAWEGDVQRAGWNPYNYPPSAPELSSLRDALYPLINHKEVPAIYPPLTELICRLASAASAATARVLSRPRSLYMRLLWQKIPYALCDLGVLGLLAGLLKRRGAPMGRLLLYAWNPLILFEFAGSGHNDALGLMLLLAGIVAWENGKPLASAVSWSAAFLSKYTSIFLLPFLAWRRRWKELVIGLALIGLGMVPFCACSLMLTGAHHYATRWNFNASLFEGLAYVTGAVGAKRFIGVGLAAGAILAGRRELDPARICFWLLGASLLFTPTMHPWYLTWMIPWLCLFPHAAWLAWNLTIFLAYTAQTRFLRYHVWNLHPAIQAIEYLPVYALLITGTWSRMKPKTQT